jgi:dimethylglycine dehydrogenase
MTTAEQRTVPHRLSPFYKKENFPDAKFTQDRFGWIRAERFTDPKEEKEAAERGVAVGDLSHLVKLSVKTNDVPRIISGLYQEKEHAVVNGDVLTDGLGVLKEVLCAVLCNDEAIFIMNPSSKDAFDKLVESNRLEQFTVTDVTSVFAGGYVVGEKSRPLLWKLTELNVDSEVFQNFRVTQSPVRRVPSIVMRFDLHGVTGYQIYFERAYSDYMREVMFGAGGEFGIIPIGSAAIELLGWRLG